MSTEYLNNKDLEKHIAKFQMSKKLMTKCAFIIEDIEEAKKRKTIRNIPVVKEQQLLVQNKAMWTVAEEDYIQAQKQLAIDFYILSENLVRYAKFNFIDADDALQEGVVICFEKVDRFISSRGRAFNYFTTCILNHYRQLYRTARNYNELKRKYYDFQQTRENKTIIKNGREVMFCKS